MSKSKTYWPLIKRKLVFPLMAILAPIVILLIVVEGGVRAAFLLRNTLEEAVLLVNVFGFDAGPIPPWRTRIIERDPLLVWRGRPNVSQDWLIVFGPAPNATAQRKLIRRFSPSVPPEFKDKPRHWVALNSEGFRGVELDGKKEERIYRIVTLGDSWTFGTTVGQNETYPALLEADLNKLDQNRKYEVVNLSVPGYSTYHGAFLIDRAIALNPDLIVIAYAMNEPRMFGASVPSPKSEDKPLMGDLALSQWDVFVRFANDDLQTVKLIRYWVDLLSYHEGSPVPGLTEEASWQRDVSRSVQKPPWLDESVREYKNRIASMSDAALARGMRVVLLYPEFWIDGPYLKPLKEISAELKLPLVDWSSLLAHAAQSKAAAREKRFGLTQSSMISLPKEDRGVDVVFRVSQGKSQVPQAIYIAGSDPALGSFEPNTIRMYDDGTHGDEVTGDGVWSVRVKLTANNTVLYTFTNSGAHGVWNGLDTPLVRQVDPGDFLSGILPLDEFGTADMHGDPWHTDSEGNSIVAKSLASIVLDQKR